MRQKASVSFLTLGNTQRSYKSCEYVGHAYIGHAHLVLHEVYCARSSYFTISGESTAHAQAALQHASSTN